MFLKRIRGELDDEGLSSEEEAEEEADAERAELRQLSHDASSASEGRVDKEKEIDVNGPESMPHLQEIRTARSTKTVREEDWEDNPFSVDRVNTRESFKSQRSRSRKGSRSRTGA
jgi:hypothetical protein